MISTLFSYYGLEGIVRNQLKTLLYQATSPKKELQIKWKRNSIELPLVDVFVSPVIDRVHIEMYNIKEMTFKSSDSDLEVWKHPPSRFGNDHLSSDCRELLP